MVRMTLRTLVAVVLVTALNSATAAAAIGRLHLQGRLGFYDAQGRHVPELSATSFELVEFVAHGREREAERIFTTMKAPRFFRVLLMAANLFKLPPEEGLAALPATLDLAERYGKYLVVTAFADTKSYPGLDFRAVVSRLGAICAARPACAAIELGNELSPIHHTQDGRLGDVAFLKQLRSLVPPDVPVSLGSTHDVHDKSDIFRDGDFLTIHGARGNGGWKNWSWVVRTGEQRELGDRLGRFPWNDESRRDDLARDKQLAIGLLCRLLRIGDTFHYGGGRFSVPPSGAELAAYEARTRAWSLIPDDWSGRHQTVGSVDSPVKGFDQSMIVRAYSSVAGSEGSVLLIGIQSGARVDWNADRWPERTMVLSEGNVQLWKVKSSVASR